MIERLIMKDDEHPDPRGELDRMLMVPAWPSPFGTSPRDAEDVPDGAPSWWLGDEEASQSFFRAMGIDPTKVGAPE